MDSARYNVGPSPDLIDPRRMDEANPIPARSHKLIARTFLAAVLATHVFFLWSVRGGIRRGDPDFTVFYTAATILRQGLGHQLYEPATQRAVQAEFACDTDIRRGPLPYIHPPFEALLFLPLTFLPYTTAFGVWNFLCLGMLTAVVFRLRRLSPALARVSSFELTLWSLAFFPIFANFHQGQDAILLLLVVTLSFGALDRGAADFAAGCWLGCGVFKFHLMVPLALILVAWRGRKFLSGFAAVAGAAVCISVALVGWNEAMQYPVYVSGVMAHAGYGAIPPRQLPNLLGLFAGWSALDVYGWQVKTLVAIGSAGFLLAAISLRRSTSTKAGFRLGFSAATIIALLVGYSTNTYDLSLLLAPIALILDYTLRDLRGQPARQAAITLPLGFLFISPLWFFLWMQWERINLIALLLLWWLFAIGRELLRMAPTESVLTSAAHSQ